MGTVNIFVIGKEVDFTVDFEVEPVEGEPVEEDFEAKYSEETKDFGEGYDAGYDDGFDAGYDKACRDFGVDVEAEEKPSEKKSVSSIDEALEEINELQALLDDAEAEVRLLREWLQLLQR